MKFTKCSATNVAVGVALLMAGLVGLPATAEDPAQEFEQLKEIEPPEGYVLHDIRECPEGKRTLALAVPDPRERDLYLAELRPVLLVLNEEGEPELEIGPETFDLDIDSLGTASWLNDGESFVFVGRPARFYSELAELDAEAEELGEEQSATDQDEEWDRYIELLERQQELSEKKMEWIAERRRTTALFRGDTATGEVERLWEIGEDVWDVDVDGEGFIHVALRDNHVYVLTAQGEHETSHAIPDVPEQSDNARHLDASSQTIWATMRVREQIRDLVRLGYGGQEPYEWEAVLEDAKVVDISGSALLYHTPVYYEISEPPGLNAYNAYAVYDVETQEHTSVPSAPDVLEVRTPSDLFAAGMLESVSLAREGAAVRYRVVDLEREHQMNPLKRWENTALYEYTLPE